MMLIKAFKLKSLIAILSIGVFFYPISCFALEKGKGKIRGVVVNATPGAGINESVRIILYQYLQDKEVGEEELQTDPEGSFKIENLVTDKDYRYFITAIYKEVEYEIGPLVFGEGNILSVKIPLYEPTSDSSGISVRMHHVLIKIARENLFQVEQYILFENKGKKTYTGEKKVKGKSVVSEFTLPPRSRDLTLLSGLMSCCIISTEKGFVDTMPIKPGTREIAFSYSVPYPSSTYQLALPIQFATENLSFLISQREELKLVSDKLQPEGAVNLNHEGYNIFSAKNLLQGAKVKAKLVGLPVKTKKVNLLLLGVIATLVLAGVIYPLTKKSRSSDINIGSSRVTLGRQRYFELLRKELLLDIVELEGKLSRGEISSEEYETLREEKKRDVVDITKKLRGV